MAPHRVVQHGMAMVRCGNQFQTPLHRASVPSTLTHPHPPEAPIGDAMSMSCPVPLRTTWCSIRALLRRFLADCMFGVG